MDFVILSFTSLFVIVDPIGLIAVFLAMTPRNTSKERIHMSALASAVAFIILLFCAITGEWFFRIFGVTMPAFEIAGGIILLFIALDMLQARRTPVKQTPEEQVEGIDKNDVAVTPLAMPLLAGPGAMTTVILLNAKAATMAQMGILIGNIFLVCILTFMILWFVSVRSSSISTILLKIITRLMGLILAAIAVQFILDGIKHAGIIL